MNLGLIWSATIIVVWILTSEDQKNEFYKHGPQAKG